MDIYRLLQVGLYESYQYSGDSLIEDIIFHYSKMMVLGLWIDRYFTMCPN